LEREVAEPGFQCQGAVEAGDGNAFVAPGFLQCLRESVWVYDPDGTAGDVFPYVRQMEWLFGAAFRRFLGNSLPLLSVQDFIGDDADEGAFHQGAALADADDLFAGDGVHKFQQIPVIVGIANVAERFWLEATVRHEPPSGRQIIDVVLKAGQGAEQFNSGGITAQGGAITAREVGVKPGSGWIYVFWYVLRSESSNGVPEQRQSFFSHFGGPGFQLAMEGEEMRSRQEILEFRRWCGHAVACNLASDAGECDAVAL